MRGAKRIIGGVAVVAGAGAAAAVAGTRTWARQTALESRHLLESLPPAARAEAPRLDSLPAPVRRYFALVLPHAMETPRSARVSWAGDFRMKPAAGWSSFTATQRFGVVQPAFVWDATIRMMPLVRVRVRDSYRAGNAGMRAALAGLIPVVDQHGTQELASSALARWVGEAPWFPWALLPRADAHGSLRWLPVDDTTAQLALTDGSLAISATFRFAADGRVVSMTTSRYRDVQGTAIVTPFEGIYGELTERAGVQVPAHAEVAWLLPEGRFAYWRGRVKAITYAR